MSSVECLREFVNERLTAAAEEIFRVFKQTIVEYEEEINRQRKLLDIVWKPEIKIHRIELPQQHACKEEEVLAEQQLLNQERNSSLDQEDPEPPQIKEEQEELCTSQQGEPLELKLETDAFMLAPVDEDSDHSEPELKSDHQLLSDNSHVAESQDQKGGKHGDSGSTRDAEPEPTKRLDSSESHSDSVNTSNLSEIQQSTLAARKSFRCDTFGKTFKSRSQFHSQLKTHMKTNISKWYTYNTCGRDFKLNSNSKDRLRVHSRDDSKPEPKIQHNTLTGKKSFKCKTCGRDFKYRSYLKIHIRSHTGEKPYSCKTCGKDFQSTSGFKSHMRSHSGEKPYICNTCGRGFKQNFNWKFHMTTHTS